MYDKNYELSIVFCPFFSLIGIFMNLFTIDSVFSENKLSIKHKLLSLHKGYYNILIWLPLLFCHGCRPSIGKIYLCRWMVAEGFKIGIQYPFVVGNWQTSSAKLEPMGENLYIILVTQITWPVIKLSSL